MGWLGRTRHDLDEVDSTQAEARALARAGADHGTVVTARVQRAGRGRRDRTWDSEPGGLYFSCVLRPKLAPEKVPPISLAAGIAVCDVVRELGVPDAYLKWPNDVLVGTAKLAGILAEATVRPGAAEALVILGIGINVGQRAFSPALAGLATSLAMECDGDKAPADVVPALCHALERWLDALFECDVGALTSAWTARADLSRRVRAQSSRGPISGRPVGLNAAGALVVVDDSGIRHTISAGDVVTLRQAQGER